MACSAGDHGCPDRVSCDPYCHVSNVEEDQQVGCHGRRCIWSVVWFDFLASVCQGMLCMLCLLCLLSLKFECGRRGTGEELWEALSLVNGVV